MCVKRGGGGGGRRVKVGTEKNYLTLLKGEKSRMQNSRMLTSKFQKCFVKAISHCEFKDWKENGVGRD